MPTQKNTMSLKKRKKDIIQTKVFLFDTQKVYKDPKDLPKIEDEINRWCWDNEVINNVDTTLNWEVGDGYIIVTICYTKVKLFSLL